MCEALEKENDEMSAQMISKKQIQVALMSDCNSLKEEKKAIIRRKVSLNSLSTPSSRHFALRRYSLILYGRYSLGSHPQRKQTRGRRRQPDAPADSAIA